MRHVLYRDPQDGRSWELTYPHSDWHGGEPPDLRHISSGEAASKYGNRVSVPLGPGESETSCREDPDLPVSPTPIQIWSFGILSFSLSLLSHLPASVPKWNTKIGWPLQESWVATGSQFYIVSTALFVVGFRNQFCDAKIARPIYGLH